PCISILPYISLRVISKTPTLRLLLAFGQEEESSLMPNVHGDRIGVPVIRSVNSAQVIVNLYFYLVVVDSSANAKPVRFVIENPLPPVIANIAVGIYRRNRGGSDKCVTRLWCSCLRTVRPIVGGVDKDIIFLCET